MDQPDITPLTIPLSKELSGLVDDALAMIFTHGTVNAMKWLAHAAATHATSKERPNE